MTLLDRTEDPAPDLIASERIITGLATIFGVLTHLGLMRVLPGGEAWMILLSLTSFASLMFLISGEVMSRSALARRRHRLMVREDEGRMSRLTRSMGSGT